MEKLEPNPFYLFLRAGVKPLVFMIKFLHKTYCIATKVELGGLLVKMTNQKSPLIFEIFAECQTTKARTGRMTLVHHHVDTPVFMPVGTQVYKIYFIYLKYVQLSYILLKTCY